MRSDGNPVRAARRRPGVVTLNRPKALNAITHDMVRALAAQLDRWAHDDAVTRVIVTAQWRARLLRRRRHPRALRTRQGAERRKRRCASSAKNTSLNASIKRYRKPYISLIDGIVMGGGVGISIHGSHRVAGDEYAVRDAGSRHRLFPGCRRHLCAAAACRARSAPMLALTGERLKAADAVLSGAATHHVKSHRFAELVEALCGDAIR